MNHYPHHIGDYLKDTAHLSLLEHGCYRRMLDVYYSREKPFADSGEACKLIGARTGQERAAVQLVLSDYFAQEADGFHQKRCDEELESYAAKANANRENGKKGGRPVTQVEPTNNPSGFISLTQNNLNQNQNQNQNQNHNQEPNQIKAGDDSGKETPTPPASPMTPAAVIAVELIKLGVNASSIHPQVVSWAESKVPLNLLVEAVSQARLYKPDEKISVAYLAKIIQTNQAGKGSVSAVIPPNPNAGTILCETCGTRTRQYTGRQCDPCWRGVINPRVAA